jgi:hypothetical protein
MAPLPYIAEVSILAAGGVAGLLAVLLWMVRVFYGDGENRPESPPPAHGRDRRPPRRG